MAPIEIEQIDSVERFAVIRRQENEEVYKCLNYLSPDFQATLVQKQLTESQAHTTSSIIEFCPSITSSQSEGINEVWREKMCTWIFRVIDHYNYNREVASVALNYLDRYLCKHRVNMETFELLSVTSLFLAIKMNEPNPLTITSFIELSRGRFDIEQMSAMENSILWTLSWHVNQPTPLCFIRNFMHLLEESGCPADVTLEIEEKATYFTELSVCDYHFVNHKPSSIGLGAILTVLDSESTLPLHILHKFFNCVQSIARIDPFSKRVQECRNHLYKTYILHTNIHKEDIESPPSPIHIGQISSECTYNTGKSDYSRKRQKYVSP